MFQSIEHFNLYIVKIIFKIVVEDFSWKLNGDFYELQY